MRGKRLMKYADKHIDWLRSSLAQRRGVVPESYEACVRVHGGADGERRALRDQRLGDARLALPVLVEHVVGRVRVHLLDGAGVSFCCAAVPA